MKIEVYKDQDDLTLDQGWKWGIVVNGEIVAETPGVYGRKSDAKRGAARFEQKIFDLYYYNGDSMPIEVLD